MIQRAPVAPISHKILTKIFDAKTKQQMARDKIRRIVDGQKARLS